MTLLNSSAIRAVDYDPRRRLLLIWFQKNGPYTYHGVPRHIYLGLIGSASPGTYYDRHIRGRYSL